jgi:hypothetical protein
MLVVEGRDWASAALETNRALETAMAAYDKPIMRMPRLLNTNGRVNIAQLGFERLLLISPHWLVQFEC